MTSALATRKRRGFTAVELLVATVLSAMLMGAILGILRSITRAERTLASQAPLQSWHARLIDALEWDFANSRSLTVLPQGVELHGFAGRDWRTGLASHRPTLIRYLIQADGDVSCLVREETRLDSLSLDNTVRELVATGVDQLSVQVTPKGTAVSASASQGTPVGSQSLSGSVQVMLMRNNSAPPLLKHSFWVE